MERQIYDLNHTRTILTVEKKILAEKCSKLKADNAVSDRAIRQGALAASKKEAAEKELREERRRLHEDITILNEEILTDSWTKDV